jgi:YidC/Oxa1 family membrane protein insertase
MDKRVLIAAGVSVLILVIWTTLFPPPRPPERPAGMQETVESTSAPTGPRGVRQEPSGAGPTEAEGAEPVGVEDVERVEAAQIEEARIENDLYEIVLTNQGARAVSWKLRDYLAIDGTPLELFPEFVDGRQHPLGVALDDPGLSALLNEALYQVEREVVPSRGDLGPGDRFTFTWADGRGLAARKVITFRHGSYLVDVDLEVTDRGRRLPARLTLGPGFGAQEPASSYYYEAMTWNRSGIVSHEQKNKKRGFDFAADSFSGNVLWAGLEDQYFAALILPGEQPARVRLDPVELRRRSLVEGEEDDAAKAELILSVSVPPGGAQLYIGPKKYRLLESLGSELEKVVWFFSNGFLAWIAKQIYFGLLWLHDHTIPNYGLAIILATFLLRLMLFPVNQYSMVSMKKTQLQMQRLQPKIKAIRAKYKKSKDAESRARMNQETMELYKREGVNPMGGVSGCLPMLAQFPILIGFYGMLTVAVDLRGAPFFGWIQDLSRADPYWITPLLMGVTMFVQQMMAMSKVKDPMQQQQQRFMMIMPVVFTVICIGLPSGLVLYWFVNNVLGIGQQWLVNNQTTRLDASMGKDRTKGADRKPAKQSTSDKKRTKVAR